MNSHEEAFVIKVTREKSLRN